MKSRQVVLKNLFVGKKWMRMWRMDFWTRCGEGESGTNGERSINKNVLLKKKKNLEPLAS